MDSLNKSYIQPLHELRYSLDHFMRALEYDENPKKKENTKKSIQSAISHLQRAYSDSIEWMLVNVKEEYTLTLSCYTNEAIQGTFPEYYTEIRPNLEKITQIINDYKIIKSVEEATESSADSLPDNQMAAIQETANQFFSEKIAGKLEQYLQTLHLRESSLIEANEKEQKVSTRDKIIIPIITAAAGAILATLITTFILL